MIDIGSYYWLPHYRYVSSDRGNSFGVRPVVVLKSGVKFAADGKDGKSESTAFNLVAVKTNNSKRADRKITTPKRKKDKFLSKKIKAFWWQKFTYREICGIPLFIIKTPYIKQYIICIK